MFALRTQSRPSIIAACLLPCLVPFVSRCPAARAQSLESSGRATLVTSAPLVSTPPEENSSTSAASLDPPEAPVPQLAGTPRPKRGTDPAEHIARRHTKVIPSDWRGQPLTAYDKVKVGVDGILSIENLAGTLISSGYEHLNDGEPNYGTDRGAFADRFGAAALRGVTQNAFTDMVFAPLFHEDPRYYVKGPQYSLRRRAVYAATRPFVTRRDDGSATVNASLLLGYAAAAALTPAYYPGSNRNFHDTASVYGGSLGGAALGCGITEFSQDVFRSLHLKRLP